MFLMWGYEGEDLEDIEATIDHVRFSMPDVFLTTVSYPIKGTPYYNKVASRIVQIKPWAQSSDRDLEISGRRPRDYYRIADELLRFEMELARLRTHAGAGTRVSELNELIQERRTSLHEYSAIEEKSA